jgi:hypothetical protein
MTIRALILLVFTFTHPASAQQKDSFPTDGNGLLDYCAVVVDIADSQNYESLLNKADLATLSQKNSWCVGFIQATLDDLTLTGYSIAVLASSRVTLSGPDDAKQVGLNLLWYANVPQNVTVLQVARILVKWLREHPERLHEPRMILMRDALSEAFPKHAAPETKKQSNSGTAKP